MPFKVAQPKTAKKWAHALEAAIAFGHKRAAQIAVTSSSNILQARPTQLLHTGSDWNKSNRFRC
jgi:hypothetical protein